MRPLVVAAAALSSACVAGGGTLTDSTGVRVRFTEGTPIAHLEGPPPIHCDGSTTVDATWGFRGSHVITLCPLVLADAHAVECRPLVCADDADCPPTSEFEPIACEDGLCARTTEPFRDVDVMSICLRDLPRPDDCAAFLEYANTALERIGGAIERHCPTGSGECSGPVTCGP